MVIHLKCPKGHPLTAPDDKIGKAGKCPECGVRFRVPKPGESRTAVESASSGSGSELTRDEAPPSDNRPIAFLCPSGHRLNGPARLAGKPGQCPHCGQRFLIPTLEELGQYQPGTSQPRQHPSGNSSAGQRSAGGPAASVEDTDLEEIEELSEADLEAAGETSIGNFGQSDVRLAEESTLFPPTAIRNGARTNSLAAMFTRLWQLRGNSQVVEITLKSGQTLLPERVGTDGPDAALIATKQDDGKLCVTAVAWDAIASLQLRNVEQLPQDLFGES